ncbi:hypothetical protein [Flagellimonas sp.]|uniref:hypothetical protein n=1 Tax=Flagellimonas sp. TaxID=2058762 RepID=UPI003B5010F1
MDTLVQVHLASQYLATAGKSFLEPKADDSHTNLGFFTNDSALRTWDLDEMGTFLAFQYDNFALKWVAKNKADVFTLKGKSHDQIVEWISKMALTSKLNKPYTYNLHYDLPYSIGDDFKFESPKPEELQRLLHLRTRSQNALKSFLQKESLESDIRIWPHHFDTGAFSVLNDGSGKSIGLGLAIPDSLVDEHYFYIGGYHEHGSIDTSAFKTLTHGEWKNDGFKGGILRASDASESKAVLFFQEALSFYN